MSIPSHLRTLSPSAIAFGLCVTGAMAGGATWALKGWDSAKNERPPASLPTEAEPNGTITITGGREVDVKYLLAPGKTTIVDFYSQYCPPCRALKPRLESLSQRRGDIVLVEIDINRPGVEGIDWNSPVARQYRLASIPHLAVYGPAGDLVAEDSADTGAARALVAQWTSP